MEGKRYLKPILQSTNMSRLLDESLKSSRNVIEITLVPRFFNRLCSELLKPQRVLQKEHI